MRPSDATARHFNRAVTLNLVCGIALGAGLISFTDAGLGWSPLPLLPRIDGVAWSASVRSAAELRADGVHALLATVRALCLVVLAVAAGTLLFRILDHGLSRRAELQLRAALGAAPRRVVGDELRRVRPALLMGAPAGLLAGWLLHRGLAVSWPGALGRWTAAGPSPTAAIAVSALFGITVAALCVPTLAAARRGLVGAFEVGAGRTAGPLQMLLRRGTTRAQFAVSMALAICTGLLLRTVPDGASRTPARDLWSVWVAQGSPSAAASLTRRVGEDTAVGTRGLWSGEGTEDAITSFCRPACSEGNMLLPVLYRRARVAVLTPGYLRLLGAAAERGRDFAETDGAGAEPVVLVNRAAAYRLFPRQDAIGQHLSVGTGETARLYRVIGIAGDLGQRGTVNGPTPIIYLSALQVPASPLELLVRAPTRRGAVGALARVGVRGGTPQRLETQVRALAAPSRWSGILLGGLGAVALVLCGLGLHGLASAGMAARTAEIGVRMALGASPARIQRLALVEALRVAGVGTLLGALLSLPFAAALRAAFGGVPWMDPGLTAGAAVLMAVIAIAACWRPALRAAAVEPREALSRG